MQHPESLSVSEMILSVFSHLSATVHCSLCLCVHRKFRGQANKQAPATALHLQHIASKMWERVPTSVSHIRQRQMISMKSILGSSQQCNVATRLPAIHKIYAAPSVSNLRLRSLPAIDIRDPADLKLERQEFHLYV